MVAYLGACEEQLDERGDDHRLLFERLLDELEKLGVDLPSDDRTGVRVIEGARTQSRSLG